VSSFKPSERANQLQSCEEIAGGLFVSSGYTSELYYELEQSIDQIAFGIEGEIAIAFEFAIRFGGRNDRLDRPNHLIARTTRLAMKRSASS
jgi:hypothetical protein